MWPTIIEGLKLYYQSSGVSQLKSSITKTKCHLLKIFVDSTHPLCSDAFFTFLSCHEVQGHELMGCKRVEVIRVLCLTGISLELAYVLHFSSVMLLEHDSKFSPVS